MGGSQDLAVRFEGEGAPVLFVHGWGISSAYDAYDFEPVFMKHAAYRRIYVDLPGVGDTPAGDIKDLDSILDQASKFVERHVLPSKFLLVGTSCGAYLARALAYRYATHVEGLLLRVPVVEPHSPNRDVDSFEPIISNPSLIASLSAADRSTLSEIITQTPKYIDSLRRKFHEAILPSVASDSPILTTIRNNPERYRLTAPMHDAGNPFTKPTLILTGRQDTDVGYRDAWPLMKPYPRATFVALDRAGHALPVDETDLFAALVSNWLSRIEELRGLAPS